VQHVTNSSVLCSCTSFTSSPIVFLHLPSQYLSWTNFVIF
jgi:hypothetical protein